LLRPGIVYVCPTGAHVVAEYCIRVVPGPRIDHVRPSADVMLRSAAQRYRDGVVGVVLSGMGSDGAHGAAAVSKAGGKVIVQEPATSEHPGMPSAAIARGNVDHILPLERIGEAIARCVAPEEPHRATAVDGAGARTSVVLADDHRIILDGLRTLLEREKDIVVVGEAEDGRRAVNLAARLKPDVVVMDVAMPGLNGIDATRRIGLLSPSTRIIALSAQVDRRTAAQMTKAGATGYLCKNSAFGELAHAIRSIAAGGSYFSPRTLRPGGAGVEREDAKVLTALEREVVQLLAEGKSLIEIATELSLSVEVVDAESRRVMKKLAIDNVAGLTRYAIREGLTSADF
jgi:chemotaxis response regulator CheB/DNA-binding CsgD family transcriptional regulator